MLASVPDSGRGSDTAVEQPAFLLPAFSAGPPVAQVERGQFDAKLAGAARALGQQVREISMQEAGASRGYWVGVQIASGSDLSRGVGTRQAPPPSVAEGY